jgi:hypothetical protein
MKDPDRIWRVYIRNPLNFGVINSSTGPVHMSTLISKDIFGSFGDPSSG